MRSGAALVDDLFVDAVEECGTPSDWESPIEHAMALAMCMLRRVRYPKIVFDLAGFSEDDALQIARVRTSREPGPKKCPVTGYRLHGDEQAVGCVFPQVTIGAYRVDFLILHTMGLEGLGGIVVERDGHDFHEKTKDQAAHDNARDRDLQTAGYKVMRFTGSELWRDAIGCADQALKVANSLAGMSEEARARATMGHQERVEWALKHLTSL